MIKYVLKDKGKSKLLVVVLWLVYAASYFIRSCYAASIAAIAGEGIYDKGEIGLIGTAFFICYGIGQLISGIVGDKVNPFIMILFGSAAGAGSCFLISVAKNLPLMLIIWAANGFFQSMLWSPILRIFSETIDQSMRQKAILNISLSLPVGTVAAYLASTLIIKYFKWQQVFICGGICALVITVIAASVMLYIKNNIEIKKVLASENGSRQKSENNIGFFAAAALSGLFVIMIPSFLHGMMRDGITNWVPTMITEVYGVPASFSVFLTIALPVFNAFGAYAVVPVYKKLGGNEMKTAGVIALVALVPMFMLFFMNKLPVYFIIILLALTTSVMYALNYLIISLVPVRFSNLSCTSSVSGMLNSAAHIGCAVSSYGFGAVSEYAGWNAVIIIWIVAALITAVSSFFSCKKWSAYIK